MLASVLFVVQMEFKFHKATHHRRPDTTLAGDRQVSVAPLRIIQRLLLRGHRQHAQAWAQRGCAGPVMGGHSRDEGEWQACHLAEPGCPTYFVEADRANVDDCGQVVAAAQSSGRLPLTNHHGTSFG